ncbi:MULTISPECIES: hypothetical protein [Cupriavidus]|uniref:IclR-ED domain-containing protein n=1 Tax=Cupriavidus pauculus TaxID=82633 RepID=A0A5P2H6X8_9BURK|nr:hypothetical protein [Cupriavidus pauculus]QET03937.1 hypothetical protein FOB72_17390 [Cupriavidus pauculus]
MQGAVYIPPQPGLPYLAVVLSADGGSMMCAAPVPSFQEGEKYVKNIIIKLSELGKGLLDR